ncbi:hypothetical protein [Streptomyces albospinus]|nr:hypothetical protein [Streptomyces albospinus]
MCDSPPDTATAHPRFADAPAGPGPAAKALTFAPAPRTATAAGRAPEPLTGSAQGRAADVRERTS